MSDEKQRRPPIEDLDRLHGEATAGEWKVHPSPLSYFQVRVSDELHEDVTTERAEDAHAIAALHNAWPQVSEYIRTLEARIERTAARCRQEIHAHKSVEYADELDMLAANIARRVLSDLGEKP